MVKKCVHCEKAQSSDNYICDVCGTELSNNGQLLEALAFWGKGKSTNVIRDLIPLGIIAASGIAAAALNTHLILFAGLAGAAVYYFMSSKSRVK